MGRFADRSYRFAKDKHWRAGAMRGFAASGHTLTVAPRLKAQRVEAGEPGVVAAPGTCGRMIWLRSATGELVTLHGFGAEPQGRIAVREPVAAIHVGPAILWLREERRLRRFSARSLQELGTVELDDIVATAGDGGDGLWLLTQGPTGAAVRWLDAHGRFCQAPIELPTCHAARAMACDPVRQRLAILDVRPEGREWWLHLVDLADCKVREPLVFPVAQDERRPARIAADDKGVFWLLSPKAGGTLIGVTAEGVETARQRPVLAGEQTLTGLFWQDGLVVSAADGLYQLVPATSEDSESESVAAVFITPLLKSPPGTPSGWNRAGMTVDLPKGGRVTATAVTSASTAIAEEFEKLVADPALQGAARVARIEELFESREVEKREQHYKGDGGEQTLHLLLDRLAAPYLWLMVGIECPAGRPAELRQLQVRYPDRSWLEDLPAIYREDPGSAAQLRQFLAPFEALYGDIDETIDRLPSQIHPETADEDRLSWLLGWLGFPPTTGLAAPIQRELLTRAGDLLTRRGTIGALREMLEIVTGHNPVTVDDSAASAGFWIVGAGPARSGPRLGRDTRVVARLPGSFRPGSGMRLGEARLSPHCDDIDQMLRVRCGLVTIRIALEPARQDTVRPIVDSLLAMFVPAHCRIDLHVGRAGRTRRGGRLDAGWQLAGNGPEAPGTARLDDPCGIELGAETALAAWHLPNRCPPPITSDGTVALDGASRLA